MSVLDSWMLYTLGCFAMFCIVYTMFSIGDKIIKHLEKKHRLDMAVYWNKYNHREWK